MHRQPRTTGSHALSQNFHPLDLHRAVQGSRDRLGLDQLDGLLLHNPSVETLRNPEIHDFFDELLRSGQTAHAGVSVETLPELEAALSIPAITIVQMPLAVVGALSGTDIPEQLRQRNIGVFVREVLGTLMPATGSLREAVSIAIAPDFVTATVIGVSTRRHLNELVSVMS